MFHGRMFHILPGKANEAKDEVSADDNEDSGNYKSKKQKELKQTAGSSHNWNTLFMGTNAVADIIATSYGRSKEEVLESSSGGTNAAVRLALGETQIVLETKKFLENHNVRLEAFDSVNAKRSKTIILAKNLPARTTEDEVRTVFDKFGLLDQVIMPPSGVTCIIQFADPSEARKAFKKLAYSKFKHLPLFLEWAPENVIKEGDAAAKREVAEKNEVEKQSEETKVDEKQPEPDQSNNEEYDDTPPEPNTTLFIKNLNFVTVEATIRDCFKDVGAIHVVQVARKHDPQNPQKQLALGYGFIQFKKSETANKALKVMQFTRIDGKSIELKRSDRTLQSDVQAERKGVNKKEQKGSTKIMIRNIPFQANQNEIRDIFKTFGELKAVRLPKKQASDQHRGFGFVDFVNKSEAKNAFDALQHSTHLYGRRLVLEWAETDVDVDEIRKRTAQHIEANDDSSRAKRDKKAFVKDENFIKFSSDIEDEPADD